MINIYLVNGHHNQAQGQTLRIQKQNVVFTPGYGTPSGKLSHLPAVAQCTT